jgi:hypothetical protein
MLPAKPSFVLICCTAVILRSCENNIMTHDFTCAHLLYSFQHQ